MDNTGYKPGNLNKQTLAYALADRTGLSRSVAADAVETVFDVIANTVAQGYSVSITNFGTMELVAKKARMARNPHSGDRIKVAARKAIKFNVSPRLTEFANSGSPEDTTIRKQAKGPSQK